MNRCTFCGEGVMQPGQQVKIIQSDPLVWAHAICARRHEEAYARQLIELHVYSFWDRIKWFNQIFEIESHEKPTWLGLQRLGHFLDILNEEMKEGEQIIDKDYVTTDEYLLDIADWLGDIIVYCASEARRWGIPIEKVLHIIMDSQESKLDDDGRPIHDERGKVLKGPKYQPPEPHIQALLKSRVQGSHLPRSSAAPEKESGT